MKRFLLTTSAAGLALTGPASAQGLVDIDRLVSEYQARGYTYIEVNQAPTQIKIEATLGDQKIEVIYDAVSGAILDSEIELADADDRGRVGVEFDREDSDFTLDDDDGDDDYDDDYDDDDDDGPDDHGSDDRDDDNSDDSDDDGDDD